MHREAQTKPQKKEKSSEFKNITKPICIRCNSSSIKKMGFRKTENRGNQQRWLCKSCKKSFTIDEGFWKMKNNPNKITEALHLYFSGTSLRKTQAHLGVFRESNCSYVTILEWIRKYATLVGNFADSLNLKVGEELMSDEMEYSVKGKQSWFVDVMDTKTRYMVSSDFMRSRTIERLVEVLKKAKDKTGEQVKIVKTDGLQGYPRVLRRTFGLQSPYHSSSKTKSKIIHNIVIASERGFNHKIERLHNSIRERTKIMRGFGESNSAKSIMKGYEIYYNFCRKHQALNKYPYELATNLELGNNKWLDLIKLAKSKK